MKYSYISTDSLAAYKPKVELLLITVTEIETLALHASMIPLFPDERIITFSKGNLTYYIGMLGHYAICHVESEMGSLSAGGSLLTIQQAISDWDPKAIIMVGIAFGKDSEKQNIGDVIVADMIIQYESKKISNDKIEYRGPKQPSSTLLLNRFKNYSRGWEHNTAAGIISRLIVGNLLSGEVLIDNKLYRDEILSAFPTAQGGEMEGAGLAASAHSLHRHWIVVKSICDFADGNKSHNKTENQQTAAVAAISLCKYIFDNEFSFEELGIKPIGNRFIQSNDKPKQDPRKVLFTVYKKDCENFYVTRDNDLIFNRFLSLGKSVWVYGKSGIGKTNLAFRNLLNENRSPYVIDCSNCSGMSHHDTLMYIYTKLLSFKDTNIETTIIPPHKLIDLIIKTIKEKLPEDACIVFEEMPISPDEMSFAGFMFSIFIKLSSEDPDSKVLFVCTSLGDPKVLFTNNHLKVLERVKFINLPMWSVIQLKELCNVICDSLGITINERDIDVLSEEADGTPRFIKNFFWNFIALSSEKNFTQLLSLTKLEYLPNAN